MSYYLKKLFRFIFKEPEEVVAEPAKKDEVLVETAETAVREISPEWESVIIRYSRGKQDVLGKFYMNGHFECFTLESLNPDRPYMEELLPVGRYELALRKEGGKHVAYHFRYKAMHRGMLWIKGAEGFPFALIHEGNNYSDVPGSILVGELPVREDQPELQREVWYSDQAYRKIYPNIADHLAKGGKVSLWIREA